MDTAYLIHRAEQVQRALQLHRQNLERRFSPDDVVDSSLDNIEMELALLIKQIKEIR